MKNLLKLFNSFTKKVFKPFIKNIIKFLPYFLSFTFLLFITVYIFECKNYTSIKNSLKDFIPVAANNFNKVLMVENGISYLDPPNTYYVLEFKHQELTNVSRDLNFRSINHFFGVFAEIEDIAFELSWTLNVLKEYYNYYHIIRNLDDLSSNEEMQLTHLDSNVRNHFQSLKDILTGKAKDASKLQPITKSYPLPTPTFTQTKTIEWKNLINPTKTIIN